MFPRPALPEDVQAQVLRDTALRFAGFVAAGLGALLMFAVVREQLGPGGA